MESQSSLLVQEIQKSIDKTMAALDLPDYINREDVEQQVALTHLELVSESPEMTLDELYQAILENVREWLAPVIARYERRVNLHDCGNVIARDRQSMLEALTVARDSLNEAIEALTPRQKYIIEMRFGIHSEPKSSQEVGDSIGLNANTVSNIERQAMSAMRTQLLQTGYQYTTRY